MTGPSSAPTLLVLSAVFFGFMAFLSKLSTNAFDGAAIAAVRFAIGLAVVLVLVLARVVRPSPRRWGLLVARGVLGGSAVLLWYLSMEHMAVGIATLLNYTSPVFTLFIARVFLGEHLPARGTLALVVTAIGVVLVVEGQPATGPVPPPPPLWIALALLSAVLSAGAVTTIRAMRHGEPPEASWDIFLFFCLFGTLCAAPVAHRWQLPGAWDAALLLGVGVAALLGQICMNNALRWIPAAVHGITAQLGVVIASGLGIVFLDEPWTATSLAGAAMTVAGATWASRVTAAPPRALDGHRPPP